MPQAAPRQTSAQPANLQWQRVAPLSAVEMLRLVRAASDLPLEEGLDAEHEALFRLRGTADAGEGIRAFVEKRDPRFTGT